MEKLRSTLGQYARFIFATCFLLLSKTVVFATDYYVSPKGSDTNVGTIDSPWKTINYAVNHTNLQGGDVIYIGGGTYVESVIMLTSGTPSARIIVRNVEGEQPIIDGAGLSYPYNWQENTGLFNIRASNITLDGLTVRNANPNSDAGNATGICVLGPNIENVTIRNCTTENTRSSGIAIWGKTFGNDYSGCQNIIIENCDISGAVNDGFNEHLTIAQGVDGYIIRNNKVHDQTEVARRPNLPIGIDSKINVRNGKVYGNEIYNLKKANGIYVDGWDSEAYNIEIYNNIIHNVDHTGIPLGAEEGGTVHNIKVYNNLIYKVGWDGISIYSANNTIADGDNLIYDIEIFNNTVVENGQYAMHIPNKNVSNIAIKNNIFANNLWSNSATIYPEVASQIDMSNNILFGEQQIWLDPMNLFEGDAPIDADPLFVNSPSSNYRLNEDSPAIGAGSSTLFADTDIEGNMRTTDAIDLGAFAHGPASGSKSDRILSFNGADSVLAGEEYTIDVNYEASSDRQIHVLFQLNEAPWTKYGQNVVNITDGKGEIGIPILIEANCPSGSEAYKWVVYMTDIGENYEERISIQRQTNISVIAYETAIFNIENKARRLQLKVESCNDNISETTPLVLVSESDSSCSEFEFVPTDGAYFFIQNVQTKGRFRPKNCNSTSNDTVEIVQVGEDAFGWCEQWRLVPMNNGYYRIENRQTGGWLRPQGCSGVAGTPISQVSQNYTGNCTQWKIVPSSRSTTSVQGSLQQPIDVILYPNPATNILKVTKIEDGDQISHLQIFDINGRRVGNQNFKENEIGQEYSLSTDNLPAGTYFLRITDKSGKLSTVQFLIDKK